MRGVFKISPEGAADFAAANLKARAIVSAGAFRVRAAVLAGSYFSGDINARDACGRDRGERDSNETCGA